MIDARVLITSRLKNASATYHHQTTTIYKLTTNIKTTWYQHELPKLPKHPTRTVSTAIHFQLVSSPQILAGRTMKDTKAQVTLTPLHLSGVLGAFSQLQREHKKHAIHPAALRAQGISHESLQFTRTAPTK